MAETPQTAVPVHEGNVFATLMKELLTMAQELEARRKFDEDVSEFMRERSLVEEFATFRKR